LNLTEEKVQWVCSKLKALLANNGAGTFGN
jgi:hypothetical protein